MASEEGPHNIDRMFNIVVVGESGVGKRSLVRRFVKKSFSGDQVSDVYVWDRKIVRRRMNNHLIIRHISIDESTRDVCSKTCLRADAIIVVFSCSDRNTFLKLEEWIRYIKASVDDKFFCIVGTKCDLQNREVSWEEIQDFSEKLGMPAFETSAQTNVGVTHAFLSVIDALLDIPVTRSSSISLGVKSSRPLFGRCVCPFPWPRWRSRSNRGARTASTLVAAEARDNTRHVVEKQVEVQKFNASKQAAETEDEENVGASATGVGEVPAPVLLDRPFRWS